MLTDAELAGLRETSQAALPDTLTVVRPAAPNDGTLNESTGEWTPTATTTIWTGKGRVRPPTTEEMAVLFGETELAKQRYVATLPYDVPEIKVDDVLTVTEGSDPRIAGLAFRVTLVSSGSWLIDRRLALETAL